MIHVKLCVKLARMNAEPSAIDPMIEMRNGPRRSCRRPATTKDVPNTKIATVKIHDVCARFHPNSFSSGAMKILHAYNDPSERFISNAPTTRSHRFGCSDMFTLQFKLSNGTNV